MAPSLEHVPEKWKPAFRKGHATTKSFRASSEKEETGFENLNAQASVPAGLACAAAICLR
jgi:hypothetical protein